jgi:L-threonylcarbamoyladenylate synthase
MPILAVDPSTPEPQAIARAAALLRAGELVAFPTETVYGLGAAALDPRAVAKIYAAKGRPSYNPLIVHVLGVEQARALVQDWPPLAQALADRFWPGPLTLVLRKRPSVPDLVTAGLDSVAVRSPSHPVARALLAAAGVAIAAPSANRFQHISPTTAEHVARSLGPQNPGLLILDGGPTHVGIESTVVSLAEAQPTLLRLGGLPAAEIEAITGPLARPLAVAESAARPSPGLDDRHYAPAASVRMLARAELERFDRATSSTGFDGDAAGLVGSISFAPAPSSSDHALVLPADPAEYARLLYAALHTLDALGCASIRIEAVPDHPAWAAVADRLARAAA